MNSGGAVELEATLLVLAPDRQLFFTELLERDGFAGLKSSGFVRLELFDRYFDLAQPELAKLDCAIRVREVREETARRVLLTFKGPAVHVSELGVQRLELEGEPTHELLVQVLEQLAEQGIRLAPELLPAPGASVDRALGELGFKQVQERSTTRLATQLVQGDRARAELVLDQVLYQAGGRSIDHHEIEIEAKGGEGAEEVRRIAQSLLEEFGPSLRPWPWSKTALGCALEELELEGRLGGILEGRELDSEGYAVVAGRLS